MPGLYDENEYDMSGTIVGIVEKSEVINGKGIEKGDVLIGFPSNGLHTNGYSLARKVLLEKYSVNDKPEGLDNCIGDELLKVHKSYLRLITRLKENISIKGFSHITGGGIVGNTNRILPAGMELKIDWKSWDSLPIFDLIQKTGNIPDEEMRLVFNLGIGLIAVVKKEDVAHVQRITATLHDNSFVIGEVV
jgi:phosphoribosylformylglycinamidine cyclo-ligase